MKKKKPDLLYVKKFRIIQLTFSFFFYNFEIMIAALSKMVTLRTDVIKTAHPLRIPMPRAVTLCSLKKKKQCSFFGYSAIRKKIFDLKTEMTT